MSGLAHAKGDTKSSDFLESLLSEHWDAAIDVMVCFTGEFRTRVDDFLNATG